MGYHGVERGILNLCVFLICCHYLVPKLKQCVAKGERYVLYFSTLS